MCVCWRGECVSVCVLEGVMSERGVCVVRVVIHIML